MFEAVADNKVLVAGVFLFLMHFVVKYCLSSCWPMYAYRHKNPTFFRENQVHILVNFAVGVSGVALQIKLLWKYVDPWFVVPAIALIAYGLYEGKRFADSTVAVLDRNVEDKLLKLTYEGRVLLYAVAILSLLLVLALK